MQPCARPTDLFVVSCPDPTLSLCCATQVTWLMAFCWLRQSLNGHQTLFLMRGWGQGTRLVYTVHEACEMCFVQFGVSYIQTDLFSYTCTRTCTCVDTHTLTHAQLDHFFAVGSPLGVFIMMREHETLVKKGHKSACSLIPKSVCKKIHNLHHPSDPIVGTSTSFCLIYYQFGLPRSQALPSPQRKIVFIFRQGEGRALERGYNLA